MRPNRNPYQSFRVCHGETQPVRNRTPRNLEPAVRLVIGLILVLIVGGFFR